jgi:hypothetical protein
LAEREAELLPLEYFHVVYTLPAPIADIAVDAVVMQASEKPSHYLHTCCREQVQQSTFTAGLLDHLVGASEYCW